MQWYYLLQGQRQGPVDDAGLEALVRQGLVQDDTLVWRDGLTEWHTYGSVKPRPAPAPPPRPEPAPPRPEPMFRPEPAPASPQPAPKPYSAPPPGSSPARSTSHGAFFFYPVLEALNDGRVIRKFVVLCLKIGAVLVALGGLLLALSVLTSSLRGTGTAALGGILFAIVILAAAACVGQIYWYRSGSVAALEHSPRNTVITIFSILSRAGGEAAATGLAGLGLGACLFLWLSPDLPLNVLNGVPFVSTVATASGFIGGIVVLVYLAALGFSSLILGYLWAECLMLLVDIERNTRKNGS